MKTTTPILIKNNLQDYYECSVDTETLENHWMFCPICGYKIDWDD